MEWSHQFLSYCHKILRSYNLNLTYIIIQDENAFVPRINHLTYSASSPSRHHDEPGLSPHDCLHIRGENIKKTDSTCADMERNYFPWSEESFAWSLCWDEDNKVLWIATPATPRARSPDTVRRSAKLTERLNFAGEENEWLLLNGCFRSHTVIQLYVGIQWGRTNRSSKFNFSFLVRFSNSGFITLKPLKQSEKYPNISWKHWNLVVAI